VYQWSTHPFFISDYICATRSIEFHQIYSLSNLTWASLLCEAVHFTSTRNQYNWCGDEWKSVTVPLASCNSMTSKSFTDHQQKNSQLMEEAKSDHIFIRPVQSNMLEWLYLVTNYTRMVLQFWNLPRTVETNIRASKIAEPCHIVWHWIFFQFFLLWIVVTGMGVSSPERRWLVQMTRWVICNPM